MNQTDNMNQTAFNKLDYVLPSFYASYLINGDDSGLTDEEKLIIDSFVSRETEHCQVYHWSIQLGEFFVSHHDLYPQVLSCQCSDFTLVWK